MKWKEVQLRAQSLIIWKLLCRKSALVCARVQFFKLFLGMVCFLCSSSNKRRSNLLYICFVLTDFWPYCGRYLCLCFSRLSEIYDEHCSNISFVKSALNEMEGGSDKSSKSNSLKATLQKGCIRFCPSHTSVAFARVQFFKLFLEMVCFLAPPTKDVHISNLLSICSVLTNF